MSSTPTTDAVCLAGFEWATNDKGQNPCLLAAYLEGACGSGYWNVPALPEGNRYNPPNANQTNVCLCSSVTYNALSLCGNCQGASYVTWPAWKINCAPDVVTVGEYRMEIPKDTSIPRWAYQDPTQMSSAAFNVTLAKQIALEDLPDTTASTANTTTTTGSGTPNPSSSSGGSSSVNVGAIAGSVVGGVSVIAIAAVLIFWFIKKRRSTRASSAPSKMYIKKWSKGVTGGAPILGGGGATSKWGGSSGGSVWGTKEMQEADASHGFLPFVVQNPSSTHPSAPTQSQGHSNQQTGAYTGAPIVAEPQHFPPSSYPNLYNSQQRQTSPTPSGMPPVYSSASSAGDHSGSKYRDQKGGGSRKPPQNQITPFILPPLVVNNALEGMSDPPDQSSAWHPTHHSRPSYTSPAPHSNAATTSHAGTRGRSGSNSSSSVAPPPFLPTTVEYPKEKQSMAAFANLANTNPMVYGFAGSGNLQMNKYYNPDDPSTFPPAILPTTTARSSTEKTRGSMEKINPPSSFHHPYATPQKTHQTHGYNNKSQGSFNDKEKEMLKERDLVVHNPTPNNGYLTGNESLHTLPNVSPITTQLNTSTNALGLNNNSNPGFTVEPQPLPQAAMSISQHGHHQRRNMAGSPTSPDVGTPQTTGSVVPLLSGWGRKTSGGTSVGHTHKKNTGGRNGSGDTTSTAPLWSPYTMQGGNDDQPYDPYRPGRI